jgi:hypothetical protein
LHAVSRRAQKHRYRVPQQQRILGIGLHQPGERKTPQQRHNDRHELITRQGRRSPDLGENAGERRQKVAKDEFGETEMLFEDAGGRGAALRRRHLAHAQQVDQRGIELDRL